MSNPHSVSEQCMGWSRGWIIMYMRWRHRWSSPESDSSSWSPWPLSSACWSVMLKCSSGSVTTTARAKSLAVDGADMKSIASVALRLHNSLQSCSPGWGGTALSWSASFSASEPAAASALSTMLFIIFPSAPPSKAGANVCHRDVDGVREAIGSNIALSNSGRTTETSLATSP
eukprot:211575-Pyramimonas_sp.AAC.2